MRRQLSNRAVFLADGAVVVHGTVEEATNEFSSFVRAQKAAETD